MIYECSHKGFRVELSDMPGTPRIGLCEECQFANFLAALDQLALGGWEPVRAAIPLATLRDSTGRPWSVGLTHAGPCYGIAVHVPRHALPGNYMIALDWWLIEKLRDRFLPPEWT